MTGKSLHAGFPLLLPKTKQQFRSFVEDLNSVATMPKAPRDASRSELENLYPLSTLRDLFVTYLITYRCISANKECR